MKLKSAQIRNFRMLKETDIEFEDKLSLVIGKNNCGKTSFLSILEKFLTENKPVFAFEDFSIDTQKAILSCEDNDKSPENYTEFALSLKLFISYNDTDDFGTASALIMDLDTTQDKFVVLFEYVLDCEKYNKLISDYREYKKNIKRDFAYYIGKNMNKYFSVRIKALENNNDVNNKIIESGVIKSIISMQVIGAKRDVNNEEGRGKSLSQLASRYYKASTKSDDEFSELQQQLQKTDESLSEIYKDLFVSIVKDITEMSYSPKEAELSIISTLSEQQIFQNNTTVKYMHDNTMLPEDYNGLGYLNLFAIIFHLRITLDEFSKTNKPDEYPTPLNLLFIEEPEAHTHPQMQYIFITNIKRLLDQYSKGFILQTVISTHSSHIVSQCDFDDIKYFYRESSTSVKSLNLKDLESKMVKGKVSTKNEQHELLYRFIKQYVTLNRSELFFADKAILIEGDTERILLPTMMKKLDKENAKTSNYVPLLSQNISIIEVGAYSHVFATFLDFLGIKTLIITDLDCAKKENNKLKKCRFDEGTETSNASIKFFTGCHELKKIIELQQPVTFAYDEEKATWNPSKNGQLSLSFQKKENGYQPRSFEDAFVSINLPFIKNNTCNFKSLQESKTLAKESPDYYEIAENCIKSKTSFALDLLLYGGKDSDDWKTPLYIQEGLKWLAQ